MKISPFKVAETRLSIRKSVKKVVPFLVVGLMLSAGESVHANVLMLVEMIILLIIKMGVRVLISGGCILVSVLHLLLFA